jgi:hypothetical protein
MESLAPKRDLCLYFYTYAAFSNIAFDSSVNFSEDMNVIRGFGTRVNNISIFEANEQLDLIY